MVRPLLYHRDLLLCQNFLQIGILRDVAFLEFNGLIVFQEQVIETFVLVVLFFKVEDFFVKFIEKEPWVFNDSSVIGSFEGEKGIELLNETGDEDVFNVWIKNGSTEFFEQVQ